MKNKRLTLLIDDKRKTVELFIENLLWGKITVNLLKFPQTKLIAGGIEEPLSLERIIEFAQIWRRVKTAPEEEKHMEGWEETYYRSTEYLYEVYFQGRFYGAVAGILHDEEYESKIRKLEEEKENWKAAFERTKADNITLANELEDRRNIIASYEKGTAFKRDDKS